MKTGIRLGTTLILGLSLATAACAENNASISVDNLTDNTLYLYCQLANNTRFYQYPNQQSHDFTITKTDYSSIDIYQVDQEPSDGANMLCSNHKNLDDQFSYKIEGDDEVVTVHGHFHYDHSYPGSITFESR